MSIRLGNKYIAGRGLSQTELDNALAGKADQNLQNVNWSNDNFVWLRNKSMELDWNNRKTCADMGLSAVNQVATLTAPDDGIFINFIAWDTAIEVNGIAISVNYANSYYCSAQAPLLVKKGDTVKAQWNALNQNVTCFVPYKIQGGENELQFGLQYAGKFATAADLDSVEKTQGLWALVGNDTDGYYRYYTKPTDNTFTSYEWAVGAPDTTDGDYVVESVKNPDGSWYMKYKSGLVDQGIVGKSYSSDGTQLTFPVAMKDTLYTITTCTNGNTLWVRQVNIYDRTTTGCKVKGATDGGSSTSIAADIRIFGKAAD